VTQKNVLSPKKVKEKIRAILTKIGAIFDQKYQNKGFQEYWIFDPWFIHPF
jgi:Uma2 family endonuclease